MQISRVTRTKQEAQAMYNKISRWYDLLEGFWEKKARILGLNKLNVKPGERVLEIGVGTGHSLVTMAQAVGESGQVYGLDLSPQMLGITQTRVAQARVSSRVVLDCGDAVQNPFSSNLFDAIFMSFILELFDTPEIPLVLSECRRVLQSQGRICVVSLSQAGKPTMMRRLYEWGHRQFPKFLDCRPIFVQHALEEAGFRSIDIKKISMWGLPVEIVLAQNNE